MAPISESESYVEALARNAKAAFEASQLLPSSIRETALKTIADELDKNRDSILSANREDIKDAQRDVDAGRMTKPILNRLDLGKPGKWEQMVKGVTDVAKLPDPTGIVSYASELDDNLELYRVSCPIGVLLVIFEARPEVVVNIAALAIKSGEQSPHSSVAYVEFPEQGMPPSSKGERNPTEQQSNSPRPSRKV